MAPMEVGNLHRRKEEHLMSPSSLRSEICQILGVKYVTTLQRKTKTVSVFPSALCERGHGHSTASKICIITTQPVSWHNG